MLLSIGYTPAMCNDGLEPLLRVVAMAGPLRGEVISWPPDEEELTFGRDSANSVETPDLTVSRRHCRLIREAGQIILEDLASANGTAAGNRRVEGRIIISPGEEFSLGDSRFRLEHATRSRAGSSVGASLEAAPLELRETIRIAAEETGIEAEDPPRSESRTFRDLNAVLRGAQAIADANSMEELAHAFAGECFAVLPAERLALVLEDMPAAAAWGWTRTRASASVPVSRTVLDLVRRDAAGLLCNDVRRSVSLSPSESLARQRVRALIAAPLRARQRHIGAVYADQTGSAAHFDEGHLKWLLALTRIASLAIDGLRRRERLENENRILRGSTRISDTIVGESARMRELYALIARVAPTDSTVLLTGETGTGKELAARAIHHGSNRATGPFVAVNCAVLSEQLLESELFGHERGAFTGAIAQKKGKVELANGGTLFLDELGELAPQLQARLLRVLQERVLDRVGGTRPIPVDVRVIAATNRDLQAMVAEGSFRSDLFYRLNVIRLALPALRDRSEDIPLLAACFAERCAARARRRVSGISPEALSILTAYDWPGNVRELENVIERAVVLGSGECILPDDLPEELNQRAPLRGEPASADYHGSVREARRRVVWEALESSGFSFTEAARKLKIHPNNLHRVVNNLGLRDQIRRHPGDMTMSASK